MGVAIKKTIGGSCGRLVSAGRAKLDRRIHEDHLRGNALRCEAVVVVKPEWSDPRPEGNRQLPVRRPHIRVKFEGGNAERAARQNRRRIRQYVCTGSGGCVVVCEIF